MARVLLLAGVLITLVASAASAAVPRFDSTRLYSEKEFADAIKPYTDAIARNANDAEAHRWLGVAYLHAFRLYRIGLAPYASEYGGRAVQSLERSVQLHPDLAALLALADAYIAAGATGTVDALHDRLDALAQPIPLK